MLGEEVSLDDTGTQGQRQLFLLSSLLNLCSYSTPTPIPSRAEPGMKPEGKVEPRVGFLPTDTSFTPDPVPFIGLRTGFPISSFVRLASRLGIQFCHVRFLRLLR